MFSACGTMRNRALHAKSFRLQRDHGETALLMQEIGKFLTLAGILLVVLGGLLWSGFGGGWLGRLPGDIRIERGHSAFYFPIVTCIIISVLLSVIMSFFRR
jgi:hypothetical protein